MLGKQLRKGLAATVLAAGMTFVQAEGPEDLEKLAEEARRAAAETPSPQPEVSKEEVRQSEEQPENPPMPESREEEKSAEKAEEMPAEEAEEKPAPKAEEKAARKETAADPAARAEALGWLGHVAADAEGVFSFYDGKGLWQEIEESGIGTTILRLLSENEVDLSDPESPGRKAAALFGEEFVVVVGKGTPRQAANLVRYSEWSNSMQMELMVKMLAADEGGMIEESPFRSFLEDPDFLANLVASAEMPPVLLGSRVSDENLRAEFGGALESFPLMAAGFLGEFDFIKVVEFEKCGISFSGLEISGEGLIEFMEEEGQLEIFDEMLNPATSKDLIKSLKSKNLIISGGKSEEGIFIYLGSDQDGLPLVEGEGKRLIDGDKLAFADGFLDKRLLTVSWMSEELLTKSREGQTILGSMAEGLKNGLKQSEGLGKTNKLVKLLDKLIKQEKKLLDANSYSDTGGLTYIAGDGLHGETFGGMMDPAFDLKTPHQLGRVGDKPFLTVQLAENAAMADQSEAYLETILLTLDEMARFATRLELDDPDFAQFVEGYALYSEKFRPDLVKLWQGLSKSSGGMGHESIIEIDLRGTLPPVAGCPDVVVEKGVAPRMTILAPVEDRAKLGEAWKEIDGAAQSILKKAGDLTETNIPRQKPMSSDSDGLKTWFFAIPMQTDDFVPSVTLDDKVIAFSTSKERAVALSKAARETPAGGKAGAWMELNFDQLHGFLTTWYTLLDEHGAELIKDEEALEEFQNNKDTIKEFIDGLQEFDSLSGSSRIEDGQLRGTWHFKTK